MADVVGGGASVGLCGGCSVMRQCRHVKVSVTNRLCQICEDYVTEGLADGDQEGVLLLLAGRLKEEFEFEGNDGKGKGKGKEMHEADKAGGWGKAEGKGRDRSRSPRRHAA